MIINLESIWISHSFERSICYVDIWSDQVRYSKRFTRAGQKSPHLTTSDVFMSTGHQQIWQIAAVRVKKIHLSYLFFACHYHDNQIENTKEMMIFLDLFWQVTRFTWRPLTPRTGPPPTCTAPPTKSTPPSLGTWWPPCTRSSRLL